LGASIIFRCQPEMLINGLGSSVCQIDGRWRNALPECLAPCVVPTISQGFVIPIEITTDENGTTIITQTTTTTQSPTQIVGGVEKVKHGTALEVKCDDNYEFPVSLLSPPTCNNGTWSIIPRCVPARCKNMPRPPKHGMVMAPKTEHGMKARFKCKDGKGPRLSAAGLHFVLIRQSVQIAIRKNRKEISYNLIKINKYNCLKMQQK